jgi:hypothetical protein
MYSRSVASPQLELSINSARYFVTSYSCVCMLATGECLTPTVQKKTLRFQALSLYRSLYLRYDIQFVVC